MGVRDVEIGSRTIRVAADVGARFWDKVAAGTWEPALIAALPGWLDAETCFLDIGSWIGPTALAAAAFGAGKVVALEPDPVAAGYLRDNVALNPHLATRVSVVEAALVARAGTVRLGDAAGKRGKSTSSLIHAGGEGAYEVVGITPEGLLEACAGWDKLVVKMDIEGGEYLVFPKAAQIFDGRVRHAHLSLHPAALGGGLRAAWATRRVMGALSAYDVASIQRERVTPQPLVGLAARTGLWAWPLSGDWMLTRRS